jgi:hypothetical protein
MAKRCGLRSVRLAKRLKDRIIRVLDDGDYLSDVVRASKGVGGGGE